MSDRPGADLTESRDAQRYQEAIALKWMYVIAMR
jgi:hypothetical protein